jgi:hypothetical protein
MRNHHVHAAVFLPWLTASSGEGEGDSSMDTQQSQDAPEHQTLPQKQFAPSGLHARLRQRLGQPLKIAVPSDGPVARIQLACSVRISGLLIVGNALISDPPIQIKSQYADLFSAASREL